MSLTLTDTGLRRGRGGSLGIFFAISAGLCLALILLVPGCPGSPLDGDQTNGNVNEQPNGLDEDITGEILNTKSKVPLSALGGAITIKYSVTGEPDNIDGLYVQVADETPGAGQIGDPEIIATD